VQKVKSLKKRTFYKKIIIFFRDLLIVLLAGLLISLILSTSYKTVIENLWRTLSFSAIMGLTLWKGNAYLISKIQETKVLNNNPSKRFFYSVIALIVYSTIAILVINFLLQIFVNGKNVLDFQFPALKYILTIVAITVIIGFTFYIKEFIIDKQKSIIREEKLKNEIIKLEYETLKNQVNPHFLFNSLNALTSIVAENDEAVRFIKNLSDVYRYVLDQRDKGVVELSRELEFVKAYSYLHQIRFGNHFSISIKVENSKRKMIVPLSVQMLVENAVKHNIVSEENPLWIQIHSNNDYLFVENNLQPKGMVRDSSKFGLKNIKSRYSYLTEKELITKKENGRFIVELPLLEIKNS